MAAAPQQARMLYEALHRSMQYAAAFPQAHQRVILWSPPHAAGMGRWVKAIRLATGAKPGLLVHLLLDRPLLLGRLPLCGVVDSWATSLLTAASRHYVQDIALSCILP